MTTLRQMNNPGSFEPSVRSPHRNIHSKEPETNVFKKMRYFAIDI